MRNLRTACVTGPIVAWLALAVVTSGPLAFGQTGEPSARSKAPFDYKDVQDCQAAFLAMPGFNRNVATSEFTYKLGSRKVTGAVKTRGFTIYRVPGEETSLAGCNVARADERITDDYATFRVVEIGKDGTRRPVGAPKKVEATLNGISYDTKTGEPDVSFEYSDVELDLPEPLSPDDVRSKRYSIVRTLVSAPRPEASRPYVDENNPDNNILGPVAPKSQGDVVPISPRQVVAMSRPLRHRLYKTLSRKQRRLYRAALRRNRCNATISIDFTRNPKREGGSVLRRKYIHIPQTRSDYFRFILKTRRYVAFAMISTKKGTYFTNLKSIGGGAYVYTDPRLADDPKAADSMIVGLR